LSGLYALVVAINALSDYFQVTEGTVTLSCDNLSATRMVSYNAFGTNPSSCAHFDLVMAIQHIKKPQLTWIHQHVKGHQDDNPDIVLNPTELVNVEMDSKAKLHWSNTHLLRDEDRIHAIEGQPWSVSLGGRKVVTNLSDKCKEWCQRPRIHSYWIEKGRFPREELNRIDYVTAGAAMRCEKPHTRRWVAKFSSDYCGVNKWMYRWKQRESAKCPRCNEPLEDVEHVWRCQGTESPQKWEAALAALSLEMRRLQTDPIVEKIIMGRLCTWQKSAKPTDSSTLPMQYKEVLTHQDNQGWINFWIGLPSTGWQEIQDAHYKRIASSKTGSSWLIAMIRKQWLIAWEIWDYRNGIVHNSEAGTDAQRVASDIRAEYDLGTPSREMRRFFRIPLRAL
jgi:hypothetical protein